MATYTPKKFVPMFKKKLIKSSGTLKDRPLSRMQKLKTYLISLKKGDIITSEFLYKLSFSNPRNALNSHSKQLDITIKRMDYDTWKVIKQYKYKKK
jgi:hypothetical protein